MDFFNVEEFLKESGQLFAYVSIFAIVFAETGLFVGFFLPGDSLLFTAGIVASQGYLNVALTCVLIFIAAVAGNCTGYVFGKHVGKRLFNRENSLLFHKEHLKRANAFYTKHGGKTIILARFMPIIRTFAPIVAGVGDLPFPIFFTYSVVGGALWAFGVTLAGFFLGKAIPDIDKYLLPIIGIVVLVSLAPAAYELLKTKEQRQKLYHLAKSFVSKGK